MGAKALLLVEWDGTEGILETIEGKKFPDGFEISVGRPTLDQVMEFVAARKTCLPVPEKGMPADVLKEEKEMAFHWLRIPWDERMKIGMEMGLVTEDQLTSRHPLQVQKELLARAVQTGVMPALWERINGFRRKWGEIE